jgi:hypothetical protein
MPKSKIIEKHYVVFFSPGTLVSETSSKPVKSWDTEAVTLLWQGIEQRHGAKPYGFRFETRLEAESIPDGRGGKLRVEPKTIKQSGMYYIDGDLQTYSEVVKANRPDEEILRSNMRNNEIPVILINTNSYKFTAAFGEEDCVVHPHTGKVLVRGDDPILAKYRKQFAREMRKAS